MSVNSFRHRRPVFAGLLIYLAVFSLFGQTNQQKQNVPLPKGGQKMEFKISSTAFANGQTIPTKYTGDGPDVSPPLAWTDPPEGTAAFVLIADDPDAPMGTWVHWVLYDIPADVRTLNENIPKEPEVLGGARQGINDFRQLGYDGPAPPPGKPHRYFFTLYAVDSRTDLPPGATKREVLKQIQGHVLGTTQIVGTYKR